MLTALAFALAASAAPAPSLSAADQEAIMKVLCSANLEKDKDGWVCRDPQTIDFGEPLEQHWLAARRGRFVAHADEWLVTLRRACNAHGCPGEAHVMRKVRGAWRRTHEIDTGLPRGEGCIQFGGMPDGLDRLACLDFVGPHQGFFTQRLVVDSFAGGELREQTLMQKDQGGECFLSPPLDAHQDDTLDLERAEPPPDGAALLARLVVRRGPCDPGSDEGHGPVVKKGEHVLRFLRRGNGVVPDAASARVIEAEDWTPPAGER